MSTHIRASTSKIAVTGDGTAPPVPAGRAGRVDSSLSTGGMSPLRAAIPAHCRVICAVRAWGALARCVLLIVGLEWALAVPWPGAAGVGLRWLAGALLACSLVGLFVIGHDCGHRSFSSNRRVNDLVGFLCMSPLLNGFHNWRIGHAHHHTHTGIRGLDTDWPEKLATLEEFRSAGTTDRLRTLAAYGSPLGLVVGFWVGVARRAWMPRGYPQVPLSRRQRRTLILSQALALLVSGGLATLCLVLGGWPALVRHYLGPLGGAACIGALITYLHHSGPDALVFERADWTVRRGQVDSTFEVRFPRWLEWLWLDINHHLPHHVAPDIPWYHLREAGAHLRAVCPGAPAQRTFTWGYLIECWRRPLLERDCYRNCYVTRSLPRRDRRRNG